MSLLVYVLGREVAAHCLQAVRIPLEFEMKGSEVLIRQEGDSLILTPIRRNRLRDLLAAWEPLDEAVPEVEDLPPQARDEF